MTKPYTTRQYLDDVTARSRRTNQSARVFLGVAGVAAVILPVLVGIVAHINLGH